MRMSQLVGRRIKEAPKDAQTASHIFLIRGGYIRPVSAGIYSLLPLGKRVCTRIETIIRDEMNRIGGQEVEMPVVLPAELWRESGRYDTTGPELLRFSDRNDKAMLLGMTHEEAVVHLTRTEVNSHKQLPVMLYQIQTKYRDEARPRAGLIRVREFTMKDAYSFHASQDCLDACYETMHGAYERIFQRVGLKDVVSILSDTGMMGGSASHEFMALADCGEDTIFMAPDGRYKANRDIATTGLSFEKDEPLPLEKVHTPGKKTIEEVAGFLGVPEDRTGKAVFYTDTADNLYFVVIRGDLEVNETKLRNHLRVSVLEPAADERIRAAGAEPGYASPMNIDPTKTRIVFDPSARESSNLVVGANLPDHHFRNFNFDRDLGDAASAVEIADVATARAGDPCPLTGEPLLMKRGIEVGNIFQLGTKYSASMNCFFQDEQGRAHPMIMGCYGIGIGRTMAAVIEQSHDKYGPIWPASIAPFDVHICALDPDTGTVRETAETLYAELLEQGLDVLFDDRGEKPGVAFAEADLIGAPIRLVVSPKNLARNEIEFKARDGSRKETMPIQDTVAFVIEAARQEPRPPKVATSGKTLEGEPPGEPREGHAARQEPRPPKDATRGKTLEGEPPGEPCEGHEPHAARALPQRKRPAHATPVERHNAPVVLFVTLAIRPRGPHLANDRFHEAFLAACREADAWTVGYYLIMPDHVHLFCRPGVWPRKGIKAWTSYLKRCVTTQLEERPSWRWQADCWDTQMRTQQHYAGKRAYVAQNPVRGKLVQHAEDWPFQGELATIMW